MNSSLIHADIFFYITSVTVVILTALLIILFYYIVKIARHLEHTAKRLKDESDHIMDDVSMIRESIEEQGGKFMSAMRFIFGSFLHFKRSSDDSAGRGQASASSKSRRGSTKASKE